MRAGFCFWIATVVALIAPSKWVNAGVVQKTSEESLTASSPPESMDGEHPTLFPPKMQSHLATETTNQPTQATIPHSWSMIIINSKKAEEGRSPMGSKMTDKRNPKDGMTDRNCNQCKSCNRVSEIIMWVVILSGGTLCIYGICMCNSSNNSNKRAVMISPVKKEDGTFGLKLSVIPPRELARIEKLSYTAHWDDIV